MSGVCLRWDLDRIFPGGSESPKFAAFITELDEKLKICTTEIKQMQIADDAQSLHEWDNLVNKINELTQEHEQAWSFVYCLTAQDVADKRAVRLFSKMGEINAAYETLLTHLDQLFLAIPEDRWKEFLQTPEAGKTVFPLQERRNLALDKMDLARETLVNSLSSDGYHAWGEVYEQVSGKIRIPFTENGKEVQLSVGQAQNRLHDSRRSVRREAFSKLEKAWEGEEDICATALNRLSGFRLNLYKNRGWASLLKEPSDNNRLAPEVLTAMWQAVEEGKELASAYLQRKAELLHLEKLSWYDLGAPLGTAASKVPYDEAAQFICQQFQQFSPDMASFARNAFDQGWLEVEDRIGKQNGGFCASFPVSQESRIFLTYDGSLQNVSTLAHELGHAFHNYVLRNESGMIQAYPASLAETASTFAEIIVAGAALDAAKSDAERLALLDDRAAHQCIGHFMNIHARFIFELDFYHARGDGPVDVAQLNEMMLAAQKRAYRDSLDQYHPRLWQSCRHYYMTSTPFYNFPYTFGYLFGCAIYARAKEEGPGFAQKYVALLEDTGRMDAAKLTRIHLGVELADPSFWRVAVNQALEDVRAFLAFTKK